MCKKRRGIRSTQSRGKQEGSGGKKEVKKSVDPTLWKGAKRLVIISYVNKRLY